MSRTLDAMTAHYEEAYADAVSKVQRDYASQFLTQFRLMLRRFNLSRHDVTISSAMGSACLCVNGDTLDTWRRHGNAWRGDWDRFPVLATLQTIEQSLCYEWADWLNGESLTKWATILERRKPRG